MIRQLARIAWWYTKAAVRVARRWWRESAATVDNYFKDRRYGIDTFGEEPPAGPPGAYADGEIYGASDYAELERVVRALDPGPGDSVVDLGCGKGRAVHCFARSKAGRVTGVELDAGLLESARANLSKLPPGMPEPRLVLADAARFEFTDETLIFMYNPFGVRTLRDVLSNIRKSLARRPRPLRVVYFGAWAEWLDAEAGFSGKTRVPGTDIYVWSVA